MDFRVLGPLTVREGNRALKLGGYRQQLVLAVLLLHPERELSADFLIDAVWGEHPPRSARKTLQAYLSRLRRALGEGVIVATQHGYILSISTSQLDSLQFEDLSARGNQLLPSNPAGAADLLGRALSLWRGMPFGDLGYEAAVQPEAQRLLEVRLTTLENRIAADLDVGLAASLAAELEQLVEEHPLRERFHEQLMMALYRSERQADALRAYQNATTLLGEELGIEPSRRLAALEEKILLQDPSIDGPEAHPSPSVAALERNPYKGLRPFSEADSGDFFGRDDLIDTLERRIRETALLVVVGASGSGKSSVVGAGLVPRLRATAHETWEIVEMVPGTHPFRELARALGQSIDSLCGDDLDLLRAVQQVASSETDRYLVVIDQCEELFHSDVDGRDRARFLRNVVEAVEDPYSQLTVVATLRADFYDRAIAEPGFGPLLAANSLTVVPMNPAELEAAAARPAAGVGVQLEPELIAELSSDMAGQPGSLPLYQYVLTLLFDERTGSTLTRSAYHQIGGLRGALALRAEGVYIDLEPECQIIARQLLLRCASLGAGRPDTRRRVDRSEIDDLGLDADSVEATLGAFDRARLLSFDRDPATGHTTVEVAHEALLAEWPRLRGWLDDAREDLRLHATLATQVAEWENSDRSPDYLLSGARLEQYEGWSEESTIHLTASERELVERSIDQRDAERAADEARRKHELDVERKSVRRLRWLVGATTIAVLVVGALSVFAMNRSREAVSNEREARARELANAARNNLTTDPELAVLLALEAVDATRSAEGHVLREAEEALHLAVNSQRLVGQATGESAVEFTSSGELVVGGDRVRFIDPLTGSTQREFAPDVGDRDIESFGVSPDGRLLATAERSSLVLREVSSGAVVMKENLYELIFDVAFSPDGRMVAALAPWGDGIKVWNVGDGEALLEVVEPEGWLKDNCCPATALIFSPDSRRVLATTWSGEVLIVDVESTEQVATLAGHDGPVTGVAYLPDGQTIVTSSFDGLVRFWDGVTGSELSSFDAGVGQVVSLAASPDGTKLLTGGDGGVVKLWSTSSGGTRLEATLSPGHQSFVLGVAFDRSGEVAASVGIDKKVLVWNVAPRGEIAAWAAGLPVAFAGDGTHIATTGPDGRSIAIRRTSDWQPETVLADVAVGTSSETDQWRQIGGIAVSPALDRVVVVTADDADGSGSVTVWDPKTGRKLHTLLEDVFVKGSVDFSDDGHLVAAAVCNRPGPTAYVWDVETAEQVFSAPASDCGQSIDLDTTGRLLAVQTIDEYEPNVRVWDIGTGAEVFARDHHPAWIGAVQFSPDGSQLLTGGGDGTVIVWDIETGDLKRVLTGHTGPVEDATWSSDGLSIISGSHDGTVRVWDVTNGETLVVLEGHDAWPFVDMTPDRQYVVTATPGTVRVWTLDLAELTAIARARVRRSLNAAECQTYHFTECPNAS